MCRFLEAALGWGQLCLPRLTDIAMYLDEDSIAGRAALHVGDPLAPGQDAQGVCNALGNVVAAGILPVLWKARFSPLLLSLQSSPVVFRENKPCHLCCRLRLLIIGM